MIICVDFDGTIVHHKYPEIGGVVLGALHTLHHLIKEGHQLILWTMRDGPLLEEAVKYCSNNGIIFWGINKNPDQDWSTSPKAHHNLLIDDRALGCPLIGASVNWKLVNIYLYYNKYITHDKKKFFHAMELDNGGYFDHLYL